MHNAKSKMELLTEAVSKSNHAMILFDCKLLNFWRYLWYSLLIPLSLSDKNYKTLAQNVSNLKSMLQDVLKNQAALMEELRTTQSYAQVGLDSLMNP